MKSLQEINNKYIILALIGLQLIITLPFINAFPIDLDEPFSIFYAQQNLGDFIPYLNTGNNPPLHFILLHFWIKLFGISAIAVRSLSLIFSLLCIPILFYFTNQLLEKKWAILTVLFFIFSSLIHFYSLEARTYSLLIFLSLFSYFQLYQIVFEQKKRYFFLGVSNALLLYSHYLSGFIIISQIIILIIFYKHTFKFFLSLLLTYFFTLILYLPGVWFFITRLQHFSSQGTWVESPTYLSLLQNLFGFFNNSFSFLILVLFVLSLFIYRKKKNLTINSFTTQEKFVLLFFVINYFGLFIFSKIVQPVFIDRYLVYLTPFFYLFIVILLSNLFPKKNNNNYVFLLLIPFIISFKIIPSNNREGDKIAKYVKQHLPKNDNYRVLITPPWYNSTFYYHFDPLLFKDYKKINHFNKYSNFSPIYSSDEFKYDINETTVFYIEAIPSLNEDIYKTLEQSYNLTQSQQFKGGYHVYIFNKK